MVNLRRVSAETFETIAKNPVRTQFIAGAFTTALVTLLYLLLFWNHFVGFRSGSGEYGSGISFLSGHFPYRDYFAAAPPLNILKSALLLSVFGKAYIVSRAAGVFERVVLAVLVYSWLARMFRASYAALAAMVTMVVSSGDLSDPIASYNHDAILFATASGFLASYVLERQRGWKSIALFACLSGICAGLSFATKQTIGPGVTVAVPVVVCACLLRFDGLRQSAVFLAGFCVGWAVCEGCFVAWLAGLGILHQAIHDIFVQGPAAKASHPGDFFTRALVIMKQFHRPAEVAVGAILFSAAAWWKSGRKRETQSSSIASIGFVLLLGVGSVAAAAVASYAGFDRGQRLLTACIYFTFFGVAALSIFYALLWLSNKLSRREAQFCLYAAVSFTVAFMLSLSWPAFEAMIVPGLGLLIAALMDGYRGWIHPLVYAGCAILLLAGTCAKLAMPFSFADFSEPPVRTAHSTSTLPQMKGFVLPAPVVRFMDDTVHIIQKNSSPQDTIFTYPDFSFFYAIADRKWPTLTASHNIDVVNDELARSEATRLLNNPPAVLIYYPGSNAVLGYYEGIWRHGQRSGLRDLIAAVETLARQYHLEESFKVPPGDQEIFVFVRPPGLQPAPGAGQPKAISQK